MTTNQRIVIWIIAALFAAVAMAILFGSDVWVTESPESLIPPLQEPVVMTAVERLPVYMPVVWKGD